MTVDQLEPGDLEVGLLGLFAPAIRGSVLEDKAFRDRSGLSVDANIRFDQLGISFRRSALFNVVRGLFAGSIKSAELSDVEKQLWTVSFDEEKKRISITREGASFFIPDFSCLHPESTKRLAWFDQEAMKHRVNDKRIGEWRTILMSRVIDDEEVDPLLSEFRLAPLYVAAAIVNQLRKQTVSVSSLVPSDVRYYDRLVGEPPSDVGLKEYFEASTSPRIKALMKQGTIEGLKDALLFSSHLWGPQAISLNDVPRETVLGFYQWLETGGDRFSQLGGIECGLAHLDVFPELEAVLERLVRLFLSDQPADKEGRLNLLCSLIVLVEGELARTGIFRQRTPYWRRLASIAHASVLERAITSVNMLPSDFTTWAMQNRGQLYYLQTFVDMRREPRWNPDFVLPEQLNAEFIGRIIGASHPNTPKVKSSELRELLTGSVANGLQSRLTFPFTFLPGALEGGVESVTEMPSDVEEKLRADLQEAELTPRSFVSLVTALIFRIGPSLAQLAAEGLRRVKHQLRQIKSQDEAFSLLSGLATVASVTRSADLADEVRILMRVVRRRPGIEITQENAMRIALVAAAANPNLTKWCKFVGDCMAEFAFEDVSTDEALGLRHHIHVLRQLEPQLWVTTGRADAAISAFIESAAA